MSVDQGCWQRGVLAALRFPDGLMPEDQGCCTISYRRHAQRPGLLAPPAN